MLKRTLHYYSGLVISVFVMMHLVNHAASIAGAAKHIEVMSALRMVYRNVFVEGMLMVAVAVQIFSGLNLFNQLRKNATGFYSRLQLWSGLYLAVFFAIHLSAIFVGRLVLNLDTNFYFGVAGINTFPFNLFFIPYYALAILSFFSHVAAVHHKKMRQSILGVTPATQSAIIIGLGVLITLLCFYGLTNHFNGVPIPDEYVVLIGK